MIVTTPGYEGNLWESAFLRSMNMCSSLVGIMTPYQFLLVQAIRLSGLEKENFTPQRLNWTAEKEKGVGFED